MKTIQCVHPPHHHNGFVATCRLWTASGGVHALLVLEPTMLVLSHDKLKSIAKSRGIRGYKNMSKGKVLNIIDEKNRQEEIKLKELFIRLQKCRFLSQK